MGSVDSIFWQAIQFGSEKERAAFLDTACGGDTQLRRRVEKLLEAHARDDDFLERPVLAIDENSSDSGEGPGTVIGRYRLVERIGEGGFGSVYRAEQTEPVKRTVALKIVRLGMDTRQVVARFHAERQALAIMDHANIARVLDAGATDTGRPYFVMELVEGQPITEFCDHEKLTIAQRLGLFLDVCGAIHHAHGRGVIHRDIKPSNVLVSLRDRQPTPKVIDFGIAKAMLEPLTGDTLVTRGDQLIGTPQYMSPEQADMSPLEIGPRSDVYSLGALLYELLTGSPPFDAEELRSAGLENMRRMIRELQPPRPSVRLRRLDDGLPAVAACRGVDPSSISRQFGGDLDWIVLKALEKEPGRRYETADELAGDVRRCLENQPVRAKRPTPLDLMAKWSRRHRSLVAAAAILFAVIASLISVGYVKEIAARRDLTAELYDSLVDEVRSARLARKEGYRELAFQRLRQASRLQTPSVDIAELRREAVACMGDFLGFRPAVTQGFAEPIRAMAVNPRMSQLALGFSSGTVSVYEIASGGQLKQITELVKHGGRVTALAYAPDGQTLLSGHNAGVVQLWRPDSDGNWVWKATATTDATLEIWSVAVTPDGQQFGALTIEDRAGYERRWKVPNRVQMWNLAENTPAEDFHAEGWMFAGYMAFSPDGRLLVTGYIGQSERGLRVWDVASRKVVRTVPTSPRMLRGLAFSPNSRLLTCVFRDGFAVYETQQFTLQTFMRGKSARWATFSPDGQYLAFASTSGEATVELWHVPANRRLAIVRQPSSLGTPRGGAFSFDGRLLISTGADQVCVWNLAAANEKFVLLGHEAGIVDVCFGQDGRRLASAGNDTKVRIWDAATGQSITAITDYDQPISTVAFSPDGQMLATGGREIVIRAAGPTYERIAVLEPQVPTVRVYGVEFSPDGKYLGAVGEFGLEVWRIARKRTEDGNRNEYRLESLENSEVKLSGALCFSPDGTRIAYSSLERQGNVIRFYDLKNAVRLPMGGPSFAVPGLQGIQFLPDGQRLVYSAPNGQLRVWHTVTGEAAMLTDQSRGRISLTADGRWLAARGPDSQATVSVWNVEQGARLFSLHDEGANAEAVAWNSSGDKLAVGFSDGRILVWSIPEIRARLAEIGLDWQDKSRAPDEQG